MSEKNEVSVDTASMQEVAVSESVRVSGNVPADLYDELFNNHRFDVRKDKGEYLAFVLAEYAKSVRKV